VLPLLFGATLIGTSVWLYYEADDPAPPVTAFWVATGFGVTAIVSLYILTLHASHGHVVDSPLFLVYDLAAAGGVGGLLVSRYDVRARRRHGRLSRRERQFRAVFEGTLDALVITDDAGRYVAANPAAADLFGLPRSELIGMRVGDFLAGDDPFTDGGRRRGEIDLQRPDGETRTVAFAATANVLPGYHLSALHDVTDRAEREAEVVEERARVRFLNRLLRHNVLNGMNLVMAKLDGLESSVPDDRQDDFDVIRHRSEEVVDLVQTARRLATDVDVDRCIDLSDPLGAAVASVRESYPEATVEYDPPEGAARVRADDMLETVFDNLLTNAFEHNDAAAVTVSVGVTVGPETVTVTVADDGDGIPPKRRTELFGDGGYSHGRDWGGFGLSIVDVLVREYDGHVWVDANEPSGVVFSVELERA
jgi:PAS domain S-box-containing protein